MSDAGRDALAQSIAVNYPVQVAFVRVVLDQLEGDEEQTRRWLDICSRAGGYVTPNYVRDILERER